MVAIVLDPARMAAISLTAFIWSYVRPLDIGLFCLFAFGRHWDALKGLVYLYINPTIVIDFAKAAVFWFTVFQLARCFADLATPSAWCDEFPAKPMLFPCKTTHTRLFPKKHSFSYSYLYVGVPVGWRGSSGGLLSADEPKDEKPWYMKWLSFRPGSWFSVDGDHYLARGHVEGGLRGKLDVYIQSEGEKPEDYPHAYLLTAARFFGYASNPISIWHLYSASKEMKAMILEVNNTFDEKHLYFLKPGPQSASSSPLEPISPWFTQTWDKDFYVSPFNSRNGSYSVAAYDPLFPSMAGNGPISTRVTLNSSKAHAKIIARVFSTDQGIDPATMSVFQKLKFLARWWWVGLATFPRTIVQAVNLMFKRKLDWISRPEPKMDTTPRRADATEKVIEIVFRKYLRHLVESAQGAVMVKYIPAGLMDISGELMISPSAQLLNDNAEEFEIKVLTPSFYSRFVHYNNDLGALISEYQSSLTIYLSDSSLLNKLPFGEVELEANPADTWLFPILANIRQPPSPIYNHKKAQLQLDVRNIKGISSKIAPSSFEAFMLSHSPHHEKREYTARVLKMFIADRIAFGSLELLDLDIFVLRSCFAWLLAGALWI